MIQKSFQPMFSLYLCTIILLTRALLINGLEAEQDQGQSLYATGGGGDSRIGNYPHIYIKSLYLEPEADRLADREFTAEKRSRMFVGKRFDSEFPLEDGENNYIVLSSAESGNPLAGDEFKRNHLFVGRRGSPRFVGKRSVERLLQRTKRFTHNEVDNEEFDGRGIEERTTEAGNEGHFWKVWMDDEDERSGMEKRSRMFVGKRPRSQVDNKRSKLFVGRRMSNIQHANSAGFPGEVEMEAEKRSRLFVGKRPSVNNHQNDDHDQKSRSEIVPAPTSPENNEKLDTQSTRDDGDLDAEKRARLFPGKRPAPGFVGKREAKK